MTESDKKMIMTNNMIEKKLIKIENYSNNFHEIPPIIGVILADQFGNTILVFEYNSENNDKYGKIKSYLSGDDVNLLEIDLISMYFSSFKTFASQTNIKNLSLLEIRGSNIKAQIYFKFNDFMIIYFLNSNTYLDSHEEANLIEYFEILINNFNYELTHFNEEKSRRVIQTIKLKGYSWLKKVNRDYLKKRSKIYIKKHQVLENIIVQLENIIENEIKEYLENLPDDILTNLVREIKNKIQDKLFRLIQDI